MLRAVTEHAGEGEKFKQMDTNFRAPLSLIKAVLPKMRENRSGKIINISSVGGMMAMPTMSIYSASKFALEGATEALWYEVKPWNIKVTLVQPGFISSDGFKKTIESKESLRSLKHPYTDYYNQYISMGLFIKKVMSKTPSTPESVAIRVLKVINQKNPPLRVAGTWDAYIFSLIRRYTPRSIYYFIFWRMLPKRMRNPGIFKPKIKISKKRYYQPETQQYDLL